jgi:hypothetical protein
MPAPDSVTYSSQLSDLAPKARKDEIPDSVSLFSQRRLAELQATPGSHAPGVMVNGGRLKRVHGEVTAGGLGVSPVPRTPWNPPLTKGDGWQDRCSPPEADRGFVGVPTMYCCHFEERSDAAISGEGDCFAFSLLRLENGPQ